jgi:hypothetical protein
MIKQLISIFFYLFISTLFIIACKSSKDQLLQKIIAGTDSDHILHFTKGEMKITDMYAEANQILPNIHNITGEHYNSINDILKDANIFNQADVYASEWDDDIADSTKQLLEQLRTILISKQVKAFPLMRKAYIR